MSQIETIEIECPECKEKQATTVWYSLNSSLDPEDKELLFAGKINMFHCQTCSHDAFIPLDFLYHDMGKRFCFQFYPLHYLENDEFFNSFTPEGQPAFGEMTEKTEKQAPYFLRTHVVFSMDALIHYVMFRDKLFAKKSEFLDTTAK